MLVALTNDLWATENVLAGFDRGGGLNYTSVVFSGQPGGVAQDLYEEVFAEMKCLYQNLYITCQGMQVGN